MLTYADLRASSLPDLEEVYRTAPLGPMPEGRFRGRVLARIDHGLGRSLAGTLIRAPFERAPFGVDFTTSAWFFIHPRARIGHFRAEVGRSRWREAEVLRLDYGVSRVPRPIRWILYDEVKPLTADLCLGLGGINAGRGWGDLFFFALTPTRD